jgi:hypothetical protein
MFGKMAFVVKVNGALARLGVNPRDIPSKARQAAQDFGHEFGLTAQETAVLLIEQVPEDLLPLAVATAKSLATQKWEREGKYKADHVRSAQEAIKKGLEQYREMISIVEAT